MKPTKTFQADAETGAADTTEAEGKKVPRSKRIYIKADGTEADDMESADGTRFTLLNPAGNVDFDYIFGKDPFADRCYANLGFVTKNGNVANTVFNDKDEPGGPNEAVAAIRDFQAKLATGIWAERATGGVGARVDKPALAGAAVEVAEAKGSKKWSEGIAAGKTPDALRGELYAEVLAKLEADPQYVRQVRGVPEIAKAYAARTGKATKTVDDVL